MCETELPLGFCPKKLPGLMVIGYLMNTHVLHTCIYIPTQETGIIEGFRRLGWLV